MSFLNLEHWLESISATDIATTGIKEVVTLTSDLSRKNLEKDFERMDTPQGTFYRKLIVSFMQVF